MLPQLSLKLLLIRTRNSVKPFFSCVCHFLIPFLVYCHNPQCPLTSHRLVRSRAFALSNLIHTKPPASSRFACTSVWHCSMLSRTLYHVLLRVSRFFFNYYKHQFGNVKRCPANIASGFFISFTLHICSIIAVVL